MDLNYMKTLISGGITVAVIFFLALLVANPVSAKSPAVTLVDNMYIVELIDPPLVYFDGDNSLLSEKPGKTALRATSPQATGVKRLNVHTADAVRYSKFLDERFTSFQAQFENKTGIKVEAKFRYRNIMNGFAAEMTAGTAEEIRDMPGVKSVTQDYKHYPQTYAGPEWIGAGAIWNGEGVLPETMGEGMVVGIIDSGINADHISFAATGEDGYTHSNPLGNYLGACNQPDVNCNDKLIGVYNFTDDDSNGIDGGGHGTHVASIAAGNVLNNKFLNFGGQALNYNLSGVAPHANIVSYKICREDDDSTPDDDEGGCQGSAITAALDQAAGDPIDVINYSIGAGFQPNPWVNSSSVRYLAIRAAGIFVATSAGNDGPGPSTVGSPANAPWVTTVASASHDGVVGTLLADMTGGNTAAPDDMVGASTTTGITTRDIVYAGDFGNALCGEGDAELASSCAASTGASAPSNWGPNTFANKIVVCDRGTYGRIEKGKNVMLSGAVGYILINTDAEGESTAADDHCLPAGHIGAQKGAILRDWLTSGGNDHQAKINGAAVRNDSSSADILATSSSRGPLSNPDGILKPDVMAPGRSILGAYVGNANSYAFLGGTSMSSPHVAGAGALIKAVNPSWGPDQIASALVLTATMELAKDFDSSPANFHQSGAGRVQADQAALSGIYLGVTAADFDAANPGNNGDPRQLNLATATDPRCKSSCEFTRRVTDSMGGGNWSVSVEGDADISVVPNQFSLTNGSSRNLTISVDTSNPDSISNWAYGTVVLTNTNGDAPDARIPVAVFSYAGDLPTEVLINTRFSSGSQMQTFDGLIGLQDGEFTAAGLVKPEVLREVVTEDPTKDDPFDGDGGTLVDFVEVTANTLRLIATTGDTTATDMDLYIGLDSNGNGIPEASETVCASTTTGSEEHCDLLQPVAGQWWVMMHSYTNTDGVEASLSFAAINSGAGSTLIATGPSGLAEDETGTIRVSWQNVEATTGDELWGAIAVGTGPASPLNIGVIPVTYSRFGEADLQKSVILGNDSPASFVLRPGNIHKRLVFDVPPGGGSVDFSLSAADAADNSDLRFNLYRMVFPDAFNDAPSVTLMPDDLPGKGQNSGNGNNGPSVTVSGGALNPGRYYIAAENTGGDSIAVTARAVYQGGSPRIMPRTGIWGDGAYGGTGGQGFEYAEINNAWFAIWYTYNEDATPTWYFVGSGALGANDNSHTVNILEFTNNPAMNPPTQKFTVVGKATFTAISETDMKVSYILNGEYGSSSLNPLSSNTCVLQGGNPVPITGTWAPTIPAAGGIGGSSVEYGDSKTLIQYLYDDFGEPRWVVSGSDANPPPAREAWEFRGFCPTCDFVQPSFSVVGTMSQTYSSDSAGEQILDFTLTAPNNSVFDRTMDVYRLSGAIECQ